MNAKNCLHAALTACVLAGGAAEAHVTNIPLAIGGTDIGIFSAYGWGAGTLPTLGDSHDLGLGEANLWTFHLDRHAFVTITMTPLGNTTLDAAFSLYAGTLFDEAHDGAGYDPLNPAALGRRLTSPIDAAPGDPGIAQFVGAVPNPAWDLPFDGSDGLTAAQWYAVHYTPHNGYRDTLNRTATGGLAYAGQFDAYANWSLSTEDSSGAGWAELIYLAHRNAAGAGGAETLVDFMLAPGDYTLVPGGANCTSESGGDACLGFEQAELALSARPVPVPGGVVMLAPALVVLGGLARRRSRAA